MKLSQVKQILNTLEEVHFELANGTAVPEHFHVTEIGSVTKHYIDCGGTIREEKVVNFQLWNANDFDHRLKPQKLQHIIELSEKALALKDAPVEVEYQSDTIGRYDLDFAGGKFILQPKNTACLASDHCGIPKEKLPLSTLKTSCCSSDAACC